MDAWSNHPFPFHDALASAVLGCGALIKMVLILKGVDRVREEELGLISVGSGSWAPTQQLHCLPYCSHSFIWKSSPPAGGSQGKAGLLGSDAFNTLSEAEIRTGDTCLWLLLVGAER